MSLNEVWDPCVGTQPAPGHRVVALTRVPALLLVAVPSLRRTGRHVVLLAGVGVFAVTWWGSPPVQTGFAGAQWLIGDARG